MSAGDKPPLLLEGLSYRGREASPVTIELTQRLSDSRWRATTLAAPRPLRRGDRLAFGDQSNRVCFLGTLGALVNDVADDGTITVEFEFAGPALDEMLAALRQG